MGDLDDLAAREAAVEAAGRRLIVLFLGEDEARGWKPIGLLPEAFRRPAVTDQHVARIRYSARGLPPGMSVVPFSGELMGTPAQPGSYVVTVTGTAVLRWPWSWLRRLHLTRGR